MTSGSTGRPFAHVNCQHPARRRPPVPTSAVHAGTGSIRSPGSPSSTRCAKAQRPLSRRELQHGLAHWRIPTSPGAEADHRHADRPADRMAADGSQPAILATYPTNLREIGKIDGGAAIRSHFQAVLTIGEMISPDQREAIRAYFGLEPLDQYGSTEIGHIAATCPHSGTSPCRQRTRAHRDRRRGRTTRLRRARGADRRDDLLQPRHAVHPLRHGRLRHAVAEPCGCGRTLPVLQRILGRARNIFRFVDGTAALPPPESSQCSPSSRTASARWFRPPSTASNFATSRSPATR